MSQLRVRDIGRVFHYRTNSLTLLLLSRSRFSACGGNTGLRFFCLVFLHCVAPTKRSVPARLALLCSLTPRRHKNNRKQPPVLRVKEKDVLK